MLLHTKRPSVLSAPSYIWLRRILCWHLVSQKQRKLLSISGRSGDSFQSSQHWCIVPLCQRCSWRCCERHGCAVGVHMPCSIFSLYYGLQLHKLMDMSYLKHDKRKHKQQRYFSLNHLTIYFIRACTFEEMMLAWSFFSLKIKCFQILKVKQLSLQNNS